MAGLNISASVPYLVYSAWSAAVAVRASTQGAAAAAAIR